jgi:hypothetical protein
MVSRKQVRASLVASLKSSPKVIWGALDVSLPPATSQRLFQSGVAQYAVQRPEPTPATQRALRGRRTLRVSWARLISRTNWNVAVALMATTVHKAGQARCHVGVAPFPPLPEPPPPIKGRLRAIWPP